MTDKTSDHLLIERVEHLETQLAFQEDSIQQLSDVMYDQQKQLDSLLLALERAQQELRSKIDHAGGASYVSSIDINSIEVPPHY